MRQQFLSSMACALMVMVASHAQAMPSAQPTASPFPFQPFAMPTPAEGVLRIRGVITQIKQVGSTGQPAMKIRIAESTSAGRSHDLAVVLITRFTPVTVVHEGKRTSTSFESLNVGQLVEVGLNGLMKPANPIQASAFEVTILE